MSTNYHNKIHGSILGSLIGDSIGFLFEGHKQSFIKNYINLINNFEIKNYCRGFNGKINGPIHKDNLNDCKWYYNFGQFTDDSQLTLEIIDNVCKNNGLFIIKDFSYQILDLFKNKKIVGYGSTTKKFTENLDRGIDYKFCGENSKSNGSVMRSDIFGLLFFYETDNKLFDCVKNQSLLTHLGYQSFACSLCVAYIIKYIMNNKTIEDDILLYEVYNQIKHVNINVANAILNMKEILNYDFDYAYKEIKKYETIIWGDETLSSCSLTTILWALYSFLKNKNNFNKCLIDSLKVGGDVDTIAKISCSFSGCYLGINKLPKEYLICLHDKKRRNYNTLNNKINVLINLIKNKKISYKY